MQIGDKLYEDYRDTNHEEFEKLQLQMALECEANGWCMEDGYDADGRRYLIINPPYIISLDELKQAKINEFKAIRDTKEVGPIAYEGYNFDYDDKARERINAAIIALSLQGEDASIEWTTADNTNVLVTADDLRGVIAAVAMRSNKLHNAYRIAKEKVLKATTKEEVEKVVLNNG